MRSVKITIKQRMEGCLERHVYHMLDMYAQQRAHFKSKMSFSSPGEGKEECVVLQRISIGVCREHRVICCCCGMSKWLLYVQVLPREKAHTLHSTAESKQHGSVFNILVHKLCIMVAQSRQWLVEVWLLAAAAFLPAGMPTNKFGIGVYTDTPGSPLLEAQLDAALNLVGGGGGGTGDVSGAGGWVTLFLCSWRDGASSSCMNASTTHDDASNTVSTTSRSYTT